MFAQNASRNRAILAELRKQYAAGGIFQSNNYTSATSIVYGALRQEILITNTATQYVFDYNAQGQNSNAQANNTSTNVLLNRNDNFHTISVGLYLKSVVTSGTAILNDRAPLFTYVDALAFVAAAGFVPADLEVFYNGVLNYTQNNDEIVRNFPTHKFRHVPESQSGAAAANITSYRQSQFEWGMGVSLQEPVLNLYGNQKNRFTLVLPTDAAYQVANTNANTSNYVVLVQYGFLASNVSK